MKRIFTIATVVVSSLFFVACGSSNSDKAVITPVKETISGPLGQYFKIVNRNYKIKNGREFNIEFERTQEGMPDPWEQGMPLGWNDGQIEPGFTVELLDADGDIVTKVQSSIVSNQEELASLVALSVGETSSISFSFVPGGGEIKEFRISSTYEYHPAKTSEAGADESLMIDTVQDAVDAYNAVQDEVMDAYDAVQGEVMNAYKDAQKEVMDAYSKEMKNALKGLL